MAGLGTAFWGKKKAGRARAVQMGHKALGNRVCYLQIPSGLSLDRGCSLGDTRVPIYHTLPRKAPPVGAAQTPGDPNRRHSLLSGVSISPDRSTVEPPRDYSLPNFIFTSSARPQILTPAVPTCRHTLSLPSWNHPRPGPRPLEPSTA